MEDPEERPCMTLPCGEREVAGREKGRLSIQQSLQRKRMRETYVVASLSVDEAEHPRRTGKRDMEPISETWLHLCRVNVAITPAH